MIRCKAAPYEGRDPYVFISYAHADAERVFPIIERMANDGFRIWYDEGIDPGSEWISNIGEHLSKASAVISLMSEAAAVSQNCREEIMFARDSKIPVLTIYLEDVEIDQGLKLALMSYQAVFKQAYEDEELFFTKVESAQMLEKCRDQKAAEEPGGDAMPGDGEVDGKPEAKPSKDPVLVEKEPDLDDASILTAAAIVEADAAKNPSSPKPKRFGIVAGIVVAAIVVIAIAAIALGGGQGGDSNKASAPDAESPAPEQSAGTDEATDTTAIPAESQDGAVAESTAAEALPEYDEAVAAALADPDAHRGETVRFVAEATTETSSAAKLFDGNVYRLRAGGYDESILLPESEQSLISGTIDNERYVLVTGSVDAKEGRGYLHSATLSDVTYIDYAAPTLASVDSGASASESGVTFTVDKVEFAAIQTRVYYTVANSRSASVNYSRPTINQDGKAYEEKYDDVFSAYRSDMTFDTSCPGERSVSGLVEYPPLNQSSFTAKIDLKSPGEIAGKELAVEVTISVP